MISAATLPHRRALAFYGASAEDDAPPMNSTGEASLLEAEMLRRWSADAYRNDPLLANALGILRRGLLANPYPVSQDTDATEAFAAWARECGHKHSHGSFASIQRMVAHHLIQDGECYVQRVWTGSGRSRNGLLLAVWPKRLVDKGRGHNFTGHEYESGVWAGTWFQGDSIEPGFQGYDPTFVRREDLIWVRYVYEGDQVEGLPRFHAAIESAQQLGDFAQTSLVQQKVAACLAAFVVAQDSIWGHRFDLGPRITDAAGNEFHDLQPGTIPIVHGAKDVKALVPGTSAAFSVDKAEGRVAAGTGLTRELVSGDMSGTSFSAARFALIARDEVTDEMAIGFDDFRTRALEWWRDAELMVGRDWSGVRFEWLARPTPSIDPEKIAKADKLEIALGIKSRRQAIAERGRDPEQVLSEVREELEEFGPVDTNDTSDPREESEDENAQDSPQRAFAA